MGLDSWIVDGLGSQSSAFLALAMQEKFPDLEFTPAFSSIGVRGTAESPLTLFSGVEPLAGAGRRHEIPVCLELGLDPHEHAASLFAVDLTVVALGFQPGFPYLSGLAPELCGIPRRPEPRPRLPRGSVAIAMDMAGIYPAELPGGWTVLGRTPLTICEAGSDFFPIRAGDTVRFVRISEAEFAAKEGQRLAD